MNGDNKNKPNLNKLPLISIVSVNYNSTHETLEFINSLLKSDYENWELIIVDNASQESPAPLIKQMYPQVRVLESKINLGFAGGNNLALEHCSGDYIFFVNNDTILPENTLGKLVNRAIEIEDLGALSPKFEYYHSPGILEYAGATNINKFTARNKLIGNCQPDKGFSGLHESQYMHGGGMLIPVEVLDSVGPMEEDFFLYYEEMDWSERIRRAGYKIYCDRDIHIYHKESASVGRLNPLKTYYMTRNRILFMRRNYSSLELIPFILFFSLISFPKHILTHILRGEYKHLRSFLRGIFFHFNPNLTYK